MEHVQPTAVDATLNEWYTVEPVLGDLWFGRPQSLARIVSNNKVPGSIGLTDNSFTCYERPDRANSYNIVEYEVEN